MDLLGSFSSAPPPPWRLFLDASSLAPVHRYLLLDASYSAPSSHRRFLLGAFFLASSAPPIVPGASSSAPNTHRLVHQRLIVCASSSDLPLLVASSLAPLTIISASYLAPPHRSVLFADLGQRPAMRLWRWVDGPGQRSLSRSVRVKAPLGELVGDVDEIEALLEGVG